MMNFLIACVMWTLTVFIVSAFTAMAIWAWVQAVKAIRNRK